MGGITNKNSRLALPGYLADPGWLFFVDQWRAADLVGLKGDRHLDSVGDFDEGNAAVHPELLTVEGH